MTVTRLFFEMNAYDIDTRIANEGRVALAPLVHGHERTKGGLVMKDEITPSPRLDGEIVELRGGIKGEDGRTAVGARGRVLVTARL